MRSYPDDEPRDEVGRHPHKGTLHVMWDGRWLALGDAEFLTENGRIVKVISFTPKEFHPEEPLTQTTREIDPREVSEDSPGVFTVSEGVGYTSEDEFRRLGGY